MDERECIILTGMTAVYHEIHYPRVRVDRTIYVSGQIGRAQISTSSWT
jgi:hypothetical protein